MDNFSATFGTTTERELRAALGANKQISLTPPSGTDGGTIDCSGIVGNYQWLRLTFVGRGYTYYFDSTQGWYYVENKPAPSGGESTEIEHVVITDDGFLSTEIDANTDYVFSGELTGLTVRLGTNNGAVPEVSQYHFSFNVPAQDITLEILPAVHMPDGFVLPQNRHYEIDIMNLYAVSDSWEVRR